MHQAIYNAVVFRRVAMPVMFVIAFVMILLSPLALAQVDDPPDTPQPPAELKAAQEPAAAFGVEFAGRWGVFMPSRGLDEAHRSGFADVNEAGGVTLTLDGPEGEQRFQSIEIEMQPVENANQGAPALPAIDAALKKQFTLHFIRASVRENENQAEAFIGPAEFIEIPQNPPEIEFKLQGAAAADRDADLRLPINWLDDKTDRLRIRFGAAENVFRREGVWDNDETEDIESAGQTIWRRAVARIDDIVVVDNQAVQNYPFKIDHSDANNGGSKTRRLIVIGENLRDLTKFGAAIRSETNKVEYAMGAQSLSQFDPELMLARAMTDGALAYAKSMKQPNPRLIAKLEARREGLLSPENLLVLYATLKPDVMPGFKRITIDDARGSWPLLFANQDATLQFSRYNDQVRTESAPVFYPGDIGAVDVVLKADIPFDSIGVQLLHRSITAEEEDAKEVAVLLAKRLKDSGATDELIFRTEPVHFRGFENQLRRPPANDDAFILNVLKGDKIGARLLDPSKLKPQPPVVIAEIYLEPNELGELWKSALQSVAKCDGDTFGGDPLYAFEKSTRFSEFSIGELVKYVSPLALIYSKAMDAQESPVDFNPSVDVYKGDHAATLLIRDELVKMMASREILLPITALADNKNGEIQALRERAIVNGPETEPLIFHGSAIWLRKPFWRQPTFSKAMKALFTSGGATTTMDNGPRSVVTLIDSLNINGLMARFDVPYAEAEAWAIKATQSAAKRQLTDLNKAIGRADQVKVCDVEELLVVAGQEAGPVVSRIVPRLVEKVSYPGSPPTEYWQPDKIARFYVERVHLAGAAVRALDQYGAIDDGYKAMAIAVATAGAAFAATAGLSGGAAIGAGLLIGGDVADMAYFGAKGLDRAIESQDFYDFAHGASLVLGDEILIEAEAQRESVEMALLGLIAPGVGAGLGVKEFRHFRNINKGKALFKAEGAGILDDLTSLDETQRTQMAAYYLDLEKTAKDGIDALSEPDRAAYGAFRKYFDDAASAPHVGSDVVQPGTHPLPKFIPPGDEPTTSVLPSFIPPGDEPATSLLPPPEFYQGSTPLESLELPPSGDVILPPAIGPPGTIVTGSPEDIAARFQEQISRNAGLWHSGIRGEQHMAPGYANDVTRLTEDGDNWLIDGNRYSLGDQLNPVGEKPGSGGGNFADVYDMVDESGELAPYVGKKYGERDPWLRFDENHPQWDERFEIETGAIHRDPWRDDVLRARGPSLSPDYAQHIEMVDDLEYGAGALEKAGIPQLEIIGVNYAGDAPIIIQRRLGYNLPEGIVAETAPGEIKKRLGATNWRDSKLKPYRKGYLDMRRNMADANIGWEDGHEGNFFYQTTDKGGVQAAILDTDRIGFVDEFRQGRQPGQWTDIMAKEWSNRVGREINTTDPHEITVASLLHKGFINVDENGRIVSGRYPVEDVRNAFPELDEMMARPKE